MYMYMYLLYVYMCVTNANECILHVCIMCIHCMLCVYGICIYVCLHLYVDIISLWKG